MHIKDTEIINVERTEEVQDIVDRMPAKGPRLVLYIVMGMVITMLALGYAIHYPEVVSGTITITMGKAPNKLVSKSSGKLLLLNHHARQEVKAGEIIALIENTTDLSDCLVIDSLINRTALSDKTIVFYDFPSDLKLGELNGKYYQYVNACRECRDYFTYNIYELNAESCKLQIESAKQSIILSEQQLALRKQQLDFYRREVSRDSFILALGDYSERALDRTRNSYTGMSESYHTMSANLTQLRHNLKVLNNELLKIRAERYNYENTLQIRLQAAYNDLCAALKDWKERYTFIAPFDGTVEFLSFWREHDFVGSGTEMFAVIPDRSPILGHMLLPSIGAGKVSPRQEVNIKLNDYPYLQYGSIQGVVQSISLVTNRQQNVASQPVDTYLVVIELPDGLKTKFGSMLEFRYEIKGIADIKTKKARLIQRLFDNLRHATS